jgi:hypothetical protein
MVPMPPRYRILALGDAQKWSKLNDSSFFFNNTRTNAKRMGARGQIRRDPRLKEPSKKNAGRDEEGRLL